MGHFSVAQRHIMQLRCMRHAQLPFWNFFSFMGLLDDIHLP